MYCCRCDALAVAAIVVDVHVYDDAVAAIGVVVHDSVFAASNYACTAVDAMHLLLLLLHVDVLMCLMLLLPLLVLLIIMILLLLLLVLVLL